MSSVSYSPPLAARDLSTTLRVEAGKDYTARPSIASSEPGQSHVVHLVDRGMFTEATIAPDRNSSDGPVVTFGGAQYNDLWGNQIEGLTSPFPAQLSFPEQGPEPVTLGSSRSPSSKEPGPSREEPRISSMFSGATRERIGRGRNRRRARSRALACVLCQPNGRKCFMVIGMHPSVDELYYLHIIYMQCTHRPPPRSGYRKLDQSYESRTTDLLDPRRPERDANSLDGIGHKRSVSLECPDKYSLSQVRDISISSQATGGRPLLNEGLEGAEHSNSDHPPGPLPPRLHVQPEHLGKPHRRSSSETLADAEDSRCLVQDTIITKKPQVDYTVDLMQSIRSRVLNIWENISSRVDMSLFVPCNVRWFMEKQFAGSNKSLGQVIVLSGTATRGQGTTCSDYICSNWPLRGPWLLDILQNNLDRASRNVEGTWPLSTYHCC